MLQSLLAYPIPIHDRSIITTPQKQLLNGLHKHYFIPLSGQRAVFYTPTKGERIDSAI